MKYIVILFLIVLSLSLVSCTTTQQSVQTTNTQGILPDSFTIKLYADFTSGGGSRYYNSSLTFQDNKLTSGWQRYESWPGTGGHDISECVVDIPLLKWVDKETKGECGYTHLESYIPLTKQGIQDKINSNEILPKDHCLHLDICYEILQQ